MNLSCATSKVRLSQLRKGNQITEQYSKMNEGVDKKGWIDVKSGEKRRGKPGILSTQSNNYTQVLKRPQK